MTEQIRKFVERHQAEINVFRSPIYISDSSVVKFIECFLESEEFKVILLEVLRKRDGQMLRSIMTEELETLRSRNVG